MVTLHVILVTWKTRLGNLSQIMTLERILEYNQIIKENETFLQSKQVWLIFIFCSLKVDFVLIFNITKLVHKLDLV